MLRNSVKKLRQTQQRDLSEYIVFFKKQLFLKNNKVNICFLYITFVMEFDTIFWKVLKYLFDNPYEEIHLRELSRKTKVSVYATKTIIDQLVNENIILERIL